MNMDEHEHEATAEDFEVVPQDEVDIEEWKGIGPGPDANLQKYDEFGAPIARPVKVRDGVRSKT